MQRTAGVQNVMECQSPSRFQWKDFLIIGGCFSLDDA